MDFSLTAINRFRHALLPRGLKLGLAKGLCLREPSGNLGIRPYDIRCGLSRVFYAGHGFSISGHIKEQDDSEGKKNESFAGKVNTQDRIIFTLLGGMCLASSLSILLGLSVYYSMASILGTGFAALRAVHPLLGNQHRESHISRDSTEQSASDSDSAVLRNPQSLERKRS